MLMVWPLMDLRVNVLSENPKLPARNMSPVFYAKATALIISMVEMMRSRFMVNRLLGLYSKMITLFESKIRNSFNNKSIPHFFMLGICFFFLFAGFGAERSGERIACAPLNRILKKEGVMAGFCWYFYYLCAQK